MAHNTRKAKRHEKAALKTQHSKRFASSSIKAMWDTSKSLRLKKFDIYFD
jgi:hypothetical protein